MQDEHFCYIFFVFKVEKDFLDILQPTHNLTFSLNAGPLSYTTPDSESSIKQKLHRKCLFK